MRDETPDSYSIKELQDSILKIAVFIDHVCKKNGIEYCLMSGSAIGALRHNGFIPWDDDLDIFMTPANYGRFIECAKKETDFCNFHIQEWGRIGKYFASSKLRLNGTTYLEEGMEKWDIHKGIFVDIFILHNCPNSSISRFFHFCASRYVVAKGMAERKNKEKSFIRKFAFAFLRIFPKWFLVKACLKIAYKYDSKSTKYVCHYFGHPGYRKGIYLSSWFFSNTTVPFEKTTLNIPIGCDEYLRSRWGDYMKLPDLSMINRSRHANNWSCTKDYSLFVNKKVIKPGFNEKNLIC